MNNRKVFCFLSLLFFVGAFGYSQRITSTTSMWDGFDGVLQQNLERGYQTQMEISHVIINATNYSDFEIEVYYRPQIDRMVASLVNRIVRHYTSLEENGSYSWFRYDENMRIDTLIRLPINRMRIVCTITREDIQTGTMSDVSIFFNYVDKNGREARRPNQELRSMRTDNHIIMNRIDNAMRRLGAFIPADGSAAPEYSLDRIVQRPLQRIEDYYLEGVLGTIRRPDPDDGQRGHVPDPEFRSQN